MYIKFRNPLKVIPFYGERLCMRIIKYVNMAQIYDGLFNELDNKLVEVILIRLRIMLCYENTDIMDFLLER